MRQPICSNPRSEMKNQQSNLYRGKKIYGSQANLTRMLHLCHIMQGQVQLIKVQTSVIKFMKYIAFSIIIHRCEMKRVQLC